MKAKKPAFYLFLLGFLFINVSAFAKSSTSLVSAIAAQYHDGQIFITWTNVPAQDTGFYYVYKSNKKISSSNIKNATYIGRVIYNFGLDYRFTLVSLDGNPRYLVTNDTPRTVLTPAQNVFVYTENKTNDTCYFAVVTSWGASKVNSHIALDSNATSYSVIGKLDPVKAYLEEANVAFDNANGGETMDVYCNYGGNTSAPNYPAMANEGCLVFHFGITKQGPATKGVAIYLKFHGGGGSFIGDQITSVMGNTWKVSFDDWIPAFSIDPKNGDNTRWFGYNQYVNIFRVSLNTKPPTSGTIEGYTFNRVDWSYAWILKKWPGSVDTTKVYLNGDSEGTGAVMVHSQVEPNKWAAGILTNPKFNLDAPQDYNPTCRYNTGNSGRNNLNVYWGSNLYTNLPTNIPKPAGGFYNIYNLTDANYMLKQNKNNSLPFLEANSGKNDNNTCWQEKPPFYDSVNFYNAGGQYFWDLRDHGGNGYNEWPNLQNFVLQDRFFTNRSYPAFSYCGIDGNPGGANVMVPPYFDGDSVGTLHGSVGWMDSLANDSPTQWSSPMFITQRVCNSGLLIPAVLPQYSTATVTLRRLQKFVNIPNNTKLCWGVTDKGVVVQSGQYKASIKKPSITIQNVRIYADTSIFTIGYCSSPRSGYIISAKNRNAEIVAFPNPCSEDYLNVQLPDELNASAKIFIYDVLGHLVMQSDIGKYYLNSQTFKINVTDFKSGIYYVNLRQDQTNETFSFIKSY